MSKLRDLRHDFWIWRVGQVDILRMRISVLLCRILGHKLEKDGWPGFLEWYVCARCPYPIGPDGNVLPIPDEEVPF